MRSEEGSCRPLSSPSPRSSRGEGWGEGLYQQADSRKVPLTRNSPLRISTSPRKRGEVRKSARCHPALALVLQPAQNLVELLEIAVADVNGTAGVAVVDTDRKAKRVADPLLQR